MTKNWWAIKNIEKVASWSPVDKRLPATIFSDASKPHMASLSWSVKSSAQSYRCTEVLLWATKEFYNDSRRPTEVLRIDLKAAPSSQSRCWDWATPNIAWMFRSYERALTWSAVTVGKDAEPPFMDPVLPRHTLIGSAEKMAYIVYESEWLRRFQAQPQPPLKRFVGSSPDTGSQTEHVLADLGQWWEPTLTR